MSNSKGFTLLEVVIAVTILAVLSFYTAQSIQSAVRSKAKVQGDIERTSTLRDAARILEKDIQTAFNYRDPNIELYNKAGKEREARSKQTQTGSQPGTPNPDPNATGSGAAGTANPGPSNQNQNNQPLPPFEPRPQVILTHLIGTEDSLHFTSLNNVRTQQGSVESDQMEVGYFLRNCRNRVNPDISSECLIRRTSPIIDDDVTEGGKEIALLENVTRFELRYLDYQENGEWLKNWRSDDGGDAVTQKHFPLAVEITLETQIPKSRTGREQKATAMTIVAEIRNPNNPLPEDPNAAAGQGPSGLGGPSNVPTN